MRERSLLALPQHGVAIADHHAGDKGDVEDAHHAEQHGGNARHRPCRGHVAEADGGNGLEAEPHAVAERVRHRVGKPHRQRTQQEHDDEQAGDGAEARLPLDLHEHAQPTHGAPLPYPKDQSRARLRRCLANPEPFAGSTPATGGWPRRWRPRPASRSRP